MKLDLGLGYLAMLFDILLDVVGSTSDIHSGQCEESASASRVGVLSLSNPSCRRLTSSPSLPFFVVHGVLSTRPVPFRIISSSVRRIASPRRCIAHFRPVGRFVVERSQGFRSRLLLGVSDSDAIHTSRVWCLLVVWNGHQSRALADLDLSRSTL